MVKKILSVILCAALSIGMLCGCNLFTHNLERDYQRVIVDIPEINYSSSDEKGIPYLTYDDGVKYYLSGGELYTRSEVENSQETYAAFKNADGKIYVYAYPENLSETDKQKVKDMLEYLLAKGEEVFDSAYPEYKDKKGYMEFSAKIPERKIYKTELANLVNNYAYTYVNSYGYTMERAVDYLLEYLIENNALLVNEAMKFYISGKLVMTQADYNNIEKSVYETIDSELRSLQEEILEEKDRPTPDYDAEEETAGDTTYPIPDEEVVEEEKFNETLWSIENEENRWPGIVGDEEVKSLELESVRRLILRLQEVIDQDFRMTDAQREKATKDIENLRNIQNTQGVQYVYPELGKTFIVDYVYRTSIMENYIVNNVQSYIEDELSGYVTVSEDEIQKEYEDRIKQQRETYGEDISAYDTAVSNEETILYHPDTNRYFYVKHILLGFSDEQNEYLSEYNANPNHTATQKKEERNRLAKEITAYAHKDGEDDTSVSYTVEQILDEVKKAVGVYASNPYLAMKEFDRLVYKYNQDPGGFEKKNGYAVRSKLDEGESDNWVEEFSAAARELNEAGVAGALYLEPIVTDYGVHLMFYVGKIKNDVLALDDYTDFSRTTTVKDLIENDLFNTKVSNAYNDWEEENVHSQIKDESKVVIYKKVFKDFYKL